jgi:hypothetical protein
MTSWRGVLCRPRVVVGGVICAAVLCYLYGRPFDRDAWHDRDAVSRNVRLDMVNDLTTRHLRGLTREQVVELLGPSDDPPDYSPDTRLYPAWDLVYDLGIVDPWWQIGPGIMEVLVIRFGPGGRIREYRIDHGWKFRP